uniref:Integrator complex subunit 14 C-terminal domain-containing protein n=1 Tax=Setaria digitata TaxID=48799 RepID=A0A915PL34_9BILA
MTLYLAVDSSLSMRLPIDENSEITRRSIACQLALQTIEKVQALDVDRKIRLVDFSHNSKIISCDIRNIEDAEKKLNCISVSASADLISLFLLVKMENDDESSTLLVFTDACTFTPEEVNLAHLPNCTVKFVCVLDEALTDENQIARLWAISLQTEGFKEEFDFETSRPWMPYFMSDYDSLDSYSDALTKDLCPVPTFLLKCGLLKAYFKAIPSVDNDDWNAVIDVIGFIPVNYLTNMPTTRHHFIISQHNSEDVINILCSSLRLEESVAICHVNKNLYVYRLSIVLFPLGPMPVSWLPPFNTISSQSVVDAGNEEQSFSVRNDGLSRPSYSSVQRTCWYEVHGLQSDIQKIARLLKKIPDRTFLFYSELNRIYAYCCAIGAEDVLEKLIQVLHEEGSTQSPLIAKHSMYTNEKLRDSDKIKEWKRLRNRTVEIVYLFVRHQRLNCLGLSDRWKVMSNGMLKLFAAAALLVFVVILLLFSVLPNSTEAVDDDNNVEWSYSIVIDAGSTGSRLFLYKYRSINDRELIDVKPVVDRLSLRPVVKKITPGLSSYRDKPEDATAYIKPLLDYAVEFIPLNEHSYTSLFIFATAGMRLLPREKQNEVLQNLRRNLPLQTTIQIIPEHIKVIEGKWEGIYSWIAVNYILGRFTRNKTEFSRQSTVGIVDMGGASIQIAVELNLTRSGIDEGVETINLGCKDNERTYSYRLFVTTFLGYGVNEALRKYEQKLSDDLIIKNSSKTYVRDPCLPVNLLKTVKRKDGSQFSRKGIGDWDLCVKNLTTLLTASVENAKCYTQKCFFGLVRSPSISLSEVELYGFSEYWFSLEDVLSLGGRYDYSKTALKSREFCHMKWLLIQMQYQNNVYPKADESRLRSQCFKSAWITIVLHEGFSISKTHNHFRSVFDVNGQEAHWALGALLYHMRYFPLRETPPRKSQRSNYRVVSSRIPIYWILSLFLLIAMALWVLYKAGKRRYLRRDPSMWGYMMLSQDQLYVQP